MALMLMFTVFNGLCVFAPSYESLFVFRFLSGLPHGAFFGVGAVVAARLADKGKEAQEGAGPAAVQFVAAHKVSKIVSGEFGMKIKSLLESLNIEMITNKDSATKIVDIIELYKQ